MRKKHIFILVFTFLTLSVSAAIFYKKHESSRALLCEVSEFLKREEKLLRQSYRTVSADEFFWTFYGKKPIQDAEKELAHVKSEYAELSCLEVDEAFGWSGVFNSEEQRTFLKILQTHKEARKKLFLNIQELKKDSDKTFARIQEDLKKYRFHVRQLKRGVLPTQIVAEACRAPASTVDPRKQSSCRRALTLTKEFRVKDESNLGNNRRILLEKWQAFREWIESTISNIEQEDGKEDAEAQE